MALATGDGWPSGVGIVDVDSDGRLDLVVSIQNTTLPRLVVLHQGADQVFSVSGTMPLSGQPLGLSLLDVDADGTLDLVVGYSDALTVLRPVGAGRFGAEDVYWIPLVDMDWSMAVGPRDAQGRALIEFNGQLFAPHVLVQANRVGSVQRAAGLSGRKGLSVATPGR